MPEFPPHDLTWTCHVCGKERPDNKISVLKKEHTFSNGVVMTQNIRYCNDEPGCIHGAEAVNLIGLLGQPEK